MPDALDVFLPQVQVPEEPNVYLLGSLERRVTVYSQQVRALNLIYALEMSVKLRPPARIGIVGAGVAGLTVAAAALQRGFHVTLLEEKPRKPLLWLQADCDKRWLHPHVYEWPAHGSLVKEATGITVMPWRADVASRVVKSLTARWEELRSRYSDPVLQEYFEVKNVRLSAGSGKRRLTWGPGLKWEDFDAVILAVGFGVEKTVEPVLLASYWRDDDLAARDISRSARCLISGNGDGGLTDVARAGLSGFQHHEIVHDLQLDRAASGQAEALAQHVENIEASVAHLSLDRTGDAAAAKILTEAYLSAQMGRVAEFVDAALKTQLSRREVLLNHDGEWPLTRRACALNRLLVSRLIAIGAVTPWPGKLTKGMIQTLENHRWRVTIEGRVEDFDRVVIRHGVDHALDKGFPLLAPTCRARFEQLTLLDLTRRDRLWPEGWFGLDDGTEPASGSLSGAPQGMPKTAALVGSGTVALGRISSNLAPKLDPSFPLDIPICEHPRPDFDRSRYLLHLSATGAEERRIRLVGKTAVLPPNLSRFSSEDPLASSRLRREAKCLPEKGQELVVDAVISTSIGHCLVLVGLGGSGKTTTIETAASAVAQSALEDQGRPAPIILKLSNYQGNLQSLVHKALSIFHGDFRSIPGQFLLLCDGLDEIPDGRAQAFLDELAELLDKNLYAAVITLRTAGLRHPASFERIERVLEIEPLSIRQIIEVAEKYFEPERRIKFLEGIRRFSRGLDPTALLKLPFGLATAMSVFDETDEVPNNASELIDTLLRLRFARNRRADRPIAPHLAGVAIQTVRRLAEWLAFEIRIEWRRAALSVSEAHQVAKKVRDALQEEQVFGADALTDVDIFTLAQHFEIFMLDASDFVRMPHDLIADHLASAVLVSNWVYHPDALQTTLADDAWVFAAPSITPDQQVAYIDIIVSVDVVLAARCAVRMNPVAAAHLEPLLIAGETHGHSVELFYAVTAMGILATPTCIAWLRQRVATTSEGSNRRWQAMRGLTIAGDRDFLAATLEEADRLTSSIAVTTGGEVTLTYMAAPDVMLPLARSRVDANPLSEDLVTSLRVIASYGDRTDWERVCQVVDATASLIVFSAAARCLHSINQERATKHLTEQAAARALPEKVYWLMMLSALGSAVDASSLVDTILEGDHAEYAKGDPQYRQHLVDLVSRHGLPPDCKVRLREAYEGADFHLRGELWQIATALQIESFDELAVAVIGNKNANEQGYAARFAFHRQWTEDTHERFTVSCVEYVRGLDVQQDDFDWHLGRILEYLLARGRREDVASAITELFRRLLPEQRAWKKKQSGRLMGAMTAVEEKEFLKEGSYTLAIQHLLPSAAQVRELLSSSLIEEVVSIDQQNNDEAGDAWRALVSMLSPDVLDERLEAIQDPDDRFFALGQVAQLGRTPRRLKLFKQDLSKAVDHPPLYKSACRLVQAFWCDEVLKYVVDAYVCADWRYTEPLNRDLVDTVARLITREQARDLVEPRLSESMPAPSAEILRRWRDLAITRRQRVT